MNSKAHSKFPALPHNVDHDTSWPDASVSFGLTRRIRADSRPPLGRTSYDHGAGDFGASSHSSVPMEDFMTQDDEFSQLPTKRPKYPNKRHLMYHNSVNSFGYTDSEERVRKFELFDICHASSIRNFYNPLLHDQRKNEIEMINFAEKKTEEILRPGMVLLKNYVSLNDQVQIVQKCRELGLGPGGFYQPGYQDGAKLRLQMMCLGRNWHPQTKYDRSYAPEIPRELTMLVQKALQDSHALIKEQDETISNAEEILPGMSPDICIVNFYSTSGRLGLHQDRDESQESLRKGLPVVSLSLGDSAEFLYGDKRDIGKAKKVLLESGDILIFGGKSRHVFHGVKSIIRGSAPPLLMKETMLRPGRLNLTFRQF